MRYSLILSNDKKTKLLSLKLDLTATEPVFMTTYPFNCWQVHPSLYQVSDRSMAKSMSNNLLYILDIRYSAFMMHHLPLEKLRSFDVSFSNHLSVHIVSTLNFCSDIEISRIGAVSRS